MTRPRELLKPERSSQQLRPTRRVAFAFQSGFVLRMTTSQRYEVSAEAAKYHASVQQRSQRRAKSHAQALGLKTHSSVQHPGREAERRAKSRQSKRRAACIEVVQVRIFSTIS